LTSDLIITLLDELEHEANVQLDELFLEVGATNVDVTRHEVVGVPYEQIINVAEAEHVDLIIMATHGRTGLSHLFLGSVAERVVHMAPCPVLIIRATA
jgi:nucleotide-binding universal stress UspA family protein